MLDSDWLRNPNLEPSLNPAPPPNGFFLGGGGVWMLTFGFLESVENLAIDSELEKMLGFEQAAIQTVQTIL